MSSFAFNSLFKDHKNKISMDGKGAWMDNVFIERLWWPLKYECVYLGEFQDGAALRKGLRKWIGFYYSERPHSLWSTGIRMRHTSEALKRRHNHDR